MNEDYTQAQIDDAKQRQQAVKDLASRLEGIALSNPYTGVPKAGRHIYGWPLQEVIHMAPPELRPGVLAEILKKRGVLAPLELDAAGIRPTISLEQKLAARLCTYEGEDIAQGFEHMNIHAAGDKVFVWIVTNDFQAVTLEDERPMYPSDALVTKIRMMRQETK